MANISRSEINRRIGKLNKDERKQILQNELDPKTWLPDELNPKTWNLQSADN